MATAAQEAEDMVSVMPCWNVPRLLPAAGMQKQQTHCHQQHSHVFFLTSAADELSIQLSFALHRHCSVTISPPPPPPPLHPGRHSSASAAEKHPLALHKQCSETINGSSPPLLPASHTLPPCCYPTVLRSWAEPWLACHHKTAVMQQQQQQQQQQQPDQHPQRQSGSMRCHQQQQQHGSPQQWMRMIIGSSSSSSSHNHHQQQEQQQRLGVQQR